MAVERTLSIIKPDAVAHNLIGAIISRFETQGLRLVAARMLHLSREQAEQFYAIHRERPFYQELVAYMTSGPIVAQVLEGENAIARNREIMGATDPKKPRPAPSAPTTPRASPKMPCMAPMPRKPPKSRSRSSSARMGCARVPCKPLEKLRVTAAANTVNLLDLNRRDLEGFSSKWARKPSAPPRS